jgi:hypothetical protein
VEKKNLDQFIAESGNVNVAQNVIAAMVEKATLEVPGVHSMTLERSVGFLNKSAKKVSGVKVMFEGKTELSLEISVVLDYGSNVISVSTAVQEKVKDAIENMIGIKVKNIDVLVEEIYVEETE